MLADHAINGTVVLPMTIALDTLLGIGRRALGPSVGLRELSLFQGALLPQGSAELRVGIELVGTEAARVTLTHPTARPAYRAQLVRIASPVPAAPPLPPLPPRATTRPPCCDAPYTEALFHGPSFMVIREVLTCDASGITARVRTAGDMGWTGHWQLDPAALDGALQLLIVWGVAQDGKRSLPTAIGGCEQWGDWPVSGEVVCHISAVHEQSSRRKATATFTDTTGTRVLARLTDIVMHTQDA